MNKKMMMKSVLTFLSAVGISALSFTAQAEDQATPFQVAAVPPAVLQLDISTACTDKDSVFKIVNNGAKWPRTSTLRVYTADNQSVISERRLRLALGQKVTFVVKDTVSEGRPVAVWVEPSWYQRDFKFDATINCN